MTSEAAREHGQDQRRLAAAYRYAASAHDQAAQICETVAELYENPGQAVHEGQITAQGRQNAAGDRMEAATSNSETVGDRGNRSDEDNRPGPLGADLAALLGATVTVLLTITGSPGAWGPLSTIIGSLLMVMLVAFFWGRRPDSPEPPWEWKKLFDLTAWKKLRDWKKWRDFFVGLAVSAVMGFVVAIASAQAIQSLKFSDNDPSECRSIAVAQATMAARDLSETDVSDISHADPSKNHLKNVDRRHKKFLQILIDNTLMSGHQTVTDTPTGEGALEYAFYHQYDVTAGDCLAGETFDSLWWVGVPTFLVTLAWWYWKGIRSLFPTQNQDARKRDVAQTHEQRHASKP